MIREWEVWSLWTRVGLVAGLILALATALAWKPARSWMREQRVQQRMDAAEKAYLAGDPAAAIRFLRAAQQLGAAGARVERMLADSMEAMQDPNALMAHAKILEDPGRSREDRLRSVRSVLQTLPFGDVRRLWIGLTEDERQDLEFRLAMADRVIRDGDFRSALRFLQSTRTGGGVVPDLEIRRIRCWISLADEEALDLAHRALVELWKSHPERRADWCGLMEEIPLGRMDALRLAGLERDLAAGLEGHPGRAELLLARIQLAAAVAAGEDSARGRILARAAESWQSSAPEELARFLESCGQWVALAESAFPTETAPSEFLLRSRIHALARLGRAEALSAVLVQADSRLNAYWRNAWRATCAHHAGDRTAAKSAWNLVLQEAEGDARDDVFLELAGHASRQGMTDEHDAAMLAAIRRGRGALPAFAALRRLVERLEQQGAESELMMILARYRPYEPWDLELEARYCHLAALLGTEPVGPCISILEKITEQEPDMTHAGAVLACLHLLDGQAKRSLETWQALSVGRDSLAPRFQAVWRVAELLALETPDSSRQSLAADLPWNALLPVERRLFRRFLRVEEPARDVPDSHGSASLPYTVLPPLPQETPNKPLPKLPPLPEKKTPQPLPDVPPLPGS